MLIKFPNQPIKEGVEARLSYCWGLSNESEVVMMNEWECAQQEVDGTADARLYMHARTIMMLMVPCQTIMMLMVPCRNYHDVDGALPELS